MTRWPTPLEPDGSAPVLMNLLASGDLVLIRQASFLVFVGKAMKESGYEIETFQQHLDGVAVPMVVKNAKGQPAAVFTYSEPWDPAAVTALSAWVAALRKAGVGVHVPVIVVSHHDPPPAASVPEVFQFIHMPEAKLPGGGQPEVPNDEGTPAEARRMAEKFVAMVQRKTGVVLDYTPATLETVDATVDQVKATGATSESASGMLYAIGCYVGEVFVRHAQGEWRSTAEMKMAQVCSWPLVVALPSGAGINPIGKVFKRFQNGPADSLPFFYSNASKY